MRRHPLPRLLLCDDCRRSLWEGAAQASSRRAPQPGIGCGRHCRRQREGTPPPLVALANAPMLASSRTLRHACRARVDANTHAATVHTGMKSGKHFLYVVVRSPTSCLPHETACGFVRRDPASVDSVRPTSLYLCLPSLSLPHPLSFSRHTHAYIAVLSVSCQYIGMRRAGFLIE